MGNGTYIETGLPGSSPRCLPMLTVLERRMPLWLRPLKCHKWGSLWVWGTETRIIWDLCASEQWDAAALDLGQNTIGWEASLCQGPTGISALPPFSSAVPWQVEEGSQQTFNHHWQVPYACDISFSGPGVTSFYSSVQWGQSPQEAGTSMWDTGFSASNITLPPLAGPGQRYATYQRPHWSALGVHSLWL